MKNTRKAVAAVATIAAAAIALATPVFAQSGTPTGTFTSPLTSAFLSVDMNGGPITSAAAPTEGWNESYSTPAFGPDPYGVTWSPWGGPTSTYGDGTQLPSSQSSPNVNASSISKTFSGVTATVSIDTTLNSAKYGTVNGVASMNSRDRGAPSGANNDNDMFRDLLFAGGSGSQVQGENYLQLSLSGLTPGNSYLVATYSFDNSGSHSMNWTATAPTTSGGLNGWWAAAPANNNTFNPPTDEQTISWTGGGATPAPAVFNLTADGSGDLTVWGWGGSGTVSQSGDTSYLNGFQIEAVPEPSTIALGVIGISSLLLRRRK